MRVNEDTVAEFLLENEYYLTALEFHQELYENNITSVQILRKFFAQPPTDNKKENISDYFKSAKKRGKNDNSEEKKDQNVDYENIIKDKNEEIRLLEYELRRSKEDIELLKKEIAQLHENKVTENKDARKEKEDSKNQNSVDALELTELEKRSINYSLQHYLVTCGYKLTTITFSDEVSDQDLSSWQQIGLNREPPSLLTLYRYFYHTGPNKYFMNIEKELEHSRKKLQKYAQKSKEMKELENQIFSLQQENQNLRTKIESGQHLVLNEEEDKGKSVQSEDIEEIMSKKNLGKFRLFPAQLPLIRRFDAFGETAKILKQIQNVVKNGKKSGGPILIIGEALPSIIPSVLLKSRKDVIPILLVAIQQHPEPKVRDELTRLLFNLIKKPDLEQRQMIMAGCVALARLIGKDRTEAELLPQCWEEISSKYEEKRVLVADSCGSLAAYTKPAMRISFILSILMEQLEDKSALVREAVAKNLAQLISFFDTDDKYTKLEEMFLKLFYDTNKNVVETVRTVFVPIFAEWCTVQGIFLKNFVPLFISEMTKLLKYMDPTRITDKDGGRIELLLQTITSLISRIYQTVLSNSPFEISPAINQFSFNSPSNGSDEEFGNKLGLSTTLNSMPLLNDLQIQSMTSAFNDNFQEPHNPKITWDELKWFMENFISQIVTAIVKSEAAESPRVINGMAVLFSVICTTFGTHFTKKMIKPQFKSHLIKESYMISTKELQTSRVRILPVFILGVLTSFEDQVLFKFLKKVSIRIALEEMDWTHSHLPSLLSSFKFLCTSANKAEGCMQMISELNDHVSSKVRLLTIHLYDALAPHLAVELIEKKIFPLLLQFTSDVDLPVRIAAIKALGGISSFLSQDALFDKLNAQMELLLANSSHQMTCEILQTFTKIIPVSKPAFRDANILPKIIKINEKNNQNKNTSQREEIAKIIFDNYRSLDGCVISQEVVGNLIIPGLKLLKEDTEELNVSYKNSVSRMLRNMQSVIG